MPLHLARRVRAVTVSSLYGQCLLRPSSQTAVLAFQGSAGGLRQQLLTHSPPLLPSILSGHLPQTSPGMATSFGAFGHPGSLPHSVPLCHPQLLAEEAGCAIQAEGRYPLGLVGKHAVPCGASKSLGSQFRRHRGL